ncbi:16S rRNA (cytosine(967)-C(5))-methyltransferase RsmB [Clostridium sp. C105KSO13]|uniref:16S rRNA (cytosine(967)-C(5))-methyltransferase RsmB n=1 Tax=Clostridium sp. C105KSO13 TaxID=1776045 RepID=UPI00074059F7|nr:16S rRNA (cytosine(967)-C(5))-methyltransferase RsmB [Clostridium sp. C105KSO13]CUX39214.1 Ribosomal RNA small subunit methyltransferase B [Clostridium sp. C105KSO13]
MTKPLNEREIVLGILLDVTEHDVYSHIALGNTLSKYQYLDKKERAFITRVTEGTLEHMIEIDYILNQFSKVKVKKMKPAIRNILRSAVYQLKYMDSVPDSAVCNEAVKLAVKKGFGPLKGFVNGVLRSTARGLDTIKYPQDPVDVLSVKYSMPRWILKKWLAEYDMDTVKKILADFQKEKPVMIRCSTSQITPEELVQKLRKEGVTVESHPYLPYAFSIAGYDYLGDLSSFREGLFAVQDISSMLVGEIAFPKDGNHIIDVCAAPGGKSIQLADMLRGTGCVKARDLTEYKVEMIRENMHRMGLINIGAAVQDATILDESSVEKADIVIADLPCSGLGVLGRKTDLKYKITEEKTKELVMLQRDILHVVCRYVKPSGTLIYSTCTINRAENMDNVRWFLETHPDFTLGSIRDKVCSKLQEAVQEEGCIQLLPGIHDSGGFFIARLVKKGAK